VPNQRTLRTDQIIELFDIIHNMYSEKPMHSKKMEFLDYEFLKQMQVPMLQVASNLRTILPIEYLNQNLEM
jgi:hypothetical protein